MARRGAETRARLVDAALEASVVASFSRFGYAARRKAFCWASPASETSGAGRVAVVTGASSGIGLACASALVAAGWQVVAVSRDPARNAAAVARLEAARPAGAAGAVSGRPADLADLAAVRALGAALVAELGRVDLLVHNAGVLNRSFHRTDQGFEATFALHVLGPFLLTALLLGPLRVAAGLTGEARVLTVSSGGMYAARLDLDRLERASPATYRGAGAYALAKRAQVELGVEWARRLGGTAVVPATMHPGWVATSALAGGLPVAARLLAPLLRPPEEGADTLVWLASVAPGAIRPGGFYLDRRRRTTARLPGTASSAGARAAAFERVASLVGVEVPGVPPTGGAGP